MYCLQQIRPHGGIFVEHLSSPLPERGQNANVSLAYTMVVDEQVLATFTEPGLPSHTQVNEVHYRWVMHDEAGSWSWFI